MNYWQKLKYKNLTLLFLSFLAVFLLSKWSVFQDLIMRIGELGYLGALIGGILFVFTFTVALAAVILFSLTDFFPLLPLALVAGLGSMLGDFIIFKFVRNRLIEELRPLYNHLGGENLTHIFHSV